MTDIQQYYIEKAIEAEDSLVLKVIVAFLRRYPTDEDIPHFSKRNIAGNLDDYKIFYDEQELGMVKRTSEKPGNGLIETGQAPTLVLSFIPFKDYQSADTPEVPESNT